MAGSCDDRRRRRTPNRARTPRCSKNTTSSLVKVFVPHCCHRGSRYRVGFNEVAAAFGELVKKIGGIWRGRGLAEHLQRLDLDAEAEARHAEHQRIRGLRLLPEGELNTALVALIKGCVPFVWAWMDTTILPVWTLRRET